MTIRYNDSWTCPRQLEIMISLAYQPPQQKTKNKKIVLQLTVEPASSSRRGTGSVRPDLAIFESSRQQIILPK